MKVDYLDKKGKKKSAQFDLEESLFVETPVMELISQYVYVYLSNSRMAQAKTKDRSEVRGGGRKPWKQKGTGRARHGSNRSPIWRGGGVTFGPTGEQNYKRKMSKKMKKKAFSSALKIKANEGAMLVSELPEVTKTREAKDYLENVDDNYRKVLIVQPDETTINRFFENLENVKVVRVGELNTYDVINANKVIACEEVVDQLKSKV